MKAMFKVTVRSRDGLQSIPFTAENVIASSAVDAIKKVDAYVRRTYKTERLVVTDVEMLGVETV